MKDMGTMDGDEDAVRDVLLATLAGLRGRSAADVARCYAPDARIADLAPPLMRTGLRPKRLQAWMDGWDGPVETEPRDIELRISGDLALVHGLQRTTTRRDGAEVAWWSRVTLGLERGADGWRIVHLHESVPFHMDGSFRAAMDLEPEPMQEETSDV